MKEIYQLNNGNINIPINIFLKEKNKYKTIITEKKRYLYNNVECIVDYNGSKSCFFKKLRIHSFSTSKLELEWEIKAIEWPQDIEWTETEEYISEEYNLDNTSIEFITTSKGFRRIVKKII